ncbi:B-cell receptor CD22-like [Scomber japonicus]|uniref:B-cell receptor CD22-like n=1 Tax=Scomber japonicus TaxID=13676 RepID=UPI0023060575|nr:B-cell receptor CD22-like [Scomber japonicus]
MVKKELILKVKLCLPVYIQTLNYGHKSQIYKCRKKRASNQSSEAEERPDDRERDAHDKPLYASVQFSNNQADPLNSNIRSDQLHRHMEEQEVTEYAAVKFNGAGSPPRTRGSTVDIHCSYRYPSSVNSVEKTFWFAKLSNKEPVDLEKDSDYTGRVQYDCDSNECTLTVTDLRLIDSAEYKFKFITIYTGSPGVTLTVTALQVHVTRITVHQSHIEAELKCLSSCSSDDNISYVWFKNGQKIMEEETYSGQFNPGDNISCALKGHEDYRSPSVYAPKLPSVSVSPSGEIIEGSSVTLTCSSDANPAAKYTWYKKNVNPDLQPLSKEPQLVFSSIQSSDSGEYYCTAENQLGKRTSKHIFIDVKYAPKLSSVSVNPSAEIVEGTSVTLNCSSDANPAANYTWYKDNQTLFHGSEGIYNFTSISSEDRAMYYCISENQYGQINSSSLFIDVLYAPKSSSVSVSTSGEIKEGSSVTLTCSSDANPAAKYTWYKSRGPKFISGGRQLVFKSIKSSDSGWYYCIAENGLGKRTSDYTSINVKYAPKLPSVSVSPSAEIVEGSSVTLTCSSDANPAANYTWYKENEDSPKASGQIFTITDVRPEHSGNYSCEAQNRKGRHNSTLHLIVVKGTGITITAGITAAILLLIIILSVYLWTRKKRVSNQPSEAEERPDDRERTQPAEQDNILYASVQFLNIQAESLYSNTRSAQLHSQMEGQEVIEYAAVKFKSPGNAPRTRGRKTGEDPAELYSTVNKTS